MIVLFGATGYTGRLTAAALVARGQRPLLAGRSRDKLEALAAELGADVDIALADAASPASVRELLQRGDVIISAVGPFARQGDAAASAAVAGGAHYLDSNGEPAFTRRVFERHGRAAAEAGIGMLTAFGWECVLGNLAGALAVREAGEDAVRVDTGYFYRGAVSFSGGTRASFADAAVRPSFAYRAGAVRTVRGADRYRTMRVDGAERPGIAFGGSEHLALPRSFPQLREVNAYQGWFGRASPRVAPLLHRLSKAGFAALEFPGMRRLMATMARHAGRSARGPSAGERAGAGVHVAAFAYDHRGTELAKVHLRGVEGYEFTARILAWGGERAEQGTLRAAGALGPVEAFGIEELEAGCREAGVARA